MKRHRESILESTENGSPALKRMKIVPETIKQIPSETFSTPIVVTTTSEEKIYTSVSKPINIFGLNGDCMGKICQYCSIADLFKMGTTSDELKTSILANGIRGRLIDFEELADCCNILELFKMFGQQMTKIKIGEKDIQYKERKFSKFDEILRLISKYCSVDTLKYLNLQYYYGTTIKKPFLYSCLPFLRSIESFMITETDPLGIEDCLDYFEFNTAFNPSVNDFVERVIGNAANINSLVIHYLKLSGRFFYANHVHNLINLSLVGCNIRVAEGLFSFLQAKPKLKTFMWNNSSLRGMDTPTSNSSNLVYELVANNIPDLESLDYFPNESSINDQNRFMSVDSDYLRPDCELIANFNKLKVLKSRVITMDCFKVLAQKNTVEKLDSLLVTIDLDMNLSFLHNYSNLKYIMLGIFEEQKDLVKVLLSKLPQLTDTHLYFNELDDNAVDVLRVAVESALNLSNLNIIALSHLSIDRAIALYSQLLEIRLRKGLFENPLTIHMAKRGLAKLVSRLGKNYRPDIIKVQFE